MAQLKSTRMSDSRCHMTRKASGLAFDSRANRFAAVRRRVASRDSVDVAPITTGADPVMEVNIKAPVPVPESGIHRAGELMKSGRLFRYGGVTKRDVSLPSLNEAMGGLTEDQLALDDVSLVEESFAELTGHKYCVALNSCGSAIYLALWAVLQKEKEAAGWEKMKAQGVLTNAFTFAAVPSAIVHAGCEPVYVNCTDKYVIDAVDFERAAVESGAKIAIVSHMRGHLCDLKAVQAVCEKHGITMIEDCAHSLGCEWDGVQSGRSSFGTVAACFSTQSNKLINSGEGGFLVTDDEEVAVHSILAAGSYEHLYRSHSAAPTNYDLFEYLKFKTPNFSLRMHQVTAAMIQPQIGEVWGRVEKHRRNHAIAIDRLAAIDSGSIYLPKRFEKATTVGDSVQFNLVGFSEDQVVAFQRECGKRGAPVEIFGAWDNARNFRNWKFAPVPDYCDPTYKVIEYAVDLRLPLHLTEGDVHTLCDIVEYALEVAA